MVTSMGSRVFRDSVAEADSTQVARLRAAGAIVVGKTNTPEFGFTAITKNPLFGVTRSPWNLERTPGGSSGGSSAAVLLRRWPAACCPWSLPPTAAARSAFPPASPAPSASSPARGGYPVGR